MDSIETVKRLQVDHGGWVDSMHEVYTVSCMIHDDAIDCIFLF